MHEEVWLKSCLRQNDSNENLDNFSNISFLYVQKKFTYDISVHFILSNVTDCKLQTICIDSTEALSTLRSTITFLK